MLLFKVFRIEGFCDKVLVYEFVENKEWLIWVCYKEEG